METKETKMKELLGKMAFAALEEMPKFLEVCCSEGG